MKFDDAIIDELANKRVAERKKKERALNKIALDNYILLSPLINNRTTTPLPNSIFHELVRKAKAYDDLLNLSETIKTLEES